ncbi:lecithin retinol acyltransferase family protein [Helicobacter felis]|nr:lecithin retinol acyltransferase family protein [Helicobacter felis]
MWPWLLGGFLGYFGYKGWKRTQGIVKEPEIGSVLCCDLFGNIAEHSGIYVGNNRIVELLSTGEVVQSSPKGFVDGLPFATEIYVFAKHQKTGETNAKGEEYVLSVGLKEVAKKAQEYVGKKFKYAKVPNSEEYNCHKFVCHCLLGEKDDSSYTLTDIKKAIRRCYKLSDEEAGFYEWDVKLS